ncbi:MAG: YHS domain-containing protein [Burkholderiales bacterium]|nr:YHS domain-containing protein [Burkholderiales bacterium]
MVTDPVCGMRVNVQDAAGKLSYQSKEYFFCSDRCLLLRAGHRHAGGLSGGCRQGCGGRHPDSRRRGAGARQEPDHGRVRQGRYAHPRRTQRHRHRTAGGSTKAKCCGSQRRWRRARSIRWGRPSGASWGGGCGPYSRRGNHDPRGDPARARPRAERSGCLRG